MNRIKRNKILVIIVSLLIFALVTYLLIYKMVLGQTGVFIGGIIGFFILAAFISTFSKSKQQLDNELKYMSNVHDNHRPKTF